MIGPRIASLVAALVLTASVDLLAQQERLVEPGARVRVSAPTIVPDRLIGTVVAIGADTCALEVEGRDAPLALPLAAVETLELHRGQKSRWVSGALIGALGGAAAGVITAVVGCSGEGCYGDSTDLTPAFAIYLGAGGAAGGALVGGLIGSFVKVDRWEAVPLNRLRVAVTPHGADGLAVSVSVAF